MKIELPSENTKDLYYQDRIAAATPFNPVDFARRFEHRRALVDGVDLHYVVGGKGPVVIFGHGWPASWYEWRKVLPLLADDFTCIAFDMPGLGDSEPPPAFDDLTIANLIDSFISRHLGADRVFIVAHDVSGPPLITYAAYHADRVIKMLLTETSLPGPEMGAILSQHINAIWHFPVNASRLAASFGTGREEAFIEQFFTKWVYNNAAIQPEDLREYVRTSRIPGALECGAAYYHKRPIQAADGDMLPAKALTMPLLFIGAELGFGGRLGGKEKAAFKTIERFATNARYEVVEKCSHWVSEDRPVFLAKRIKDFFQEQ